MHDQPRGFVDHDEGFIFVHKLECYRLRLRVGVRLDTRPELHGFPSAEDFPRFHAPVVHQHLAIKDPALERRSRIIGEQAADSLIDAHACEIPRDHRGEVLTIHELIVSHPPNGSP